MLTPVNPRHATSRGRVPSHARRLRSHHVLRAIAVMATATLAFVAAGVATAYNQFQGNIETADVEELLGDFRPPEPTPDPTDPNAGTPVNILVLGSDTREGNERYTTDDVDGERADTTIVLHISADRSRVEMVSIPRDSLVDIPECLRADGSSSRPQYDAMFNSAYSTGGESGAAGDAAACAQKTLESITGVFIHHFVVVDMAGFVNMVDAIGGVPMCIPEDIRSQKAHLDLTAGQQVLDGVTALAFARTRTGDGLDGSDLSRIGRQQELLAATARTVLGMNILTNVPELIRFLSATTSSLTVSSGLGSIPDMTGLALSLRSVGPSDITFLTIPNRPAASNRNRVEWTEDATRVWANIVADIPVATGAAVDPDAPTENAAGTTAPGTASTPPTTPTPARTPGVDAFTPADTTAVCG